LIKKRNSYQNNAKDSFKILQEEGLFNHIFKNTKYLKTDEKKIDFLTIAGPVYVVKM